MIKLKGMKRLQVLFSVKSFAMQETQLAKHIAQINMSVLSIKTQGKDAVTFNVDKTVRQGTSLRT